MSLLVDLDGFDRLDLQQARREAARVRRIDADDERPIVQLLPDRAVVAAGGELAADHEVDPVGELLDLLEDV